MTFLVSRKAASQVPRTEPSVKSRPLSGKASWSRRTLSWWSPTYQWKAVPQMYFAASGSV